MSNSEAITQVFERQKEEISQSDLTELLDVAIEGYKITFSTPSEQIAREFLMELPNNTSFGIKIRGDDGKDYVFYPKRVINDDHDVAAETSTSGERKGTQYEIIREPILCIDNFPDFVQALKELTEASWEVQNKPGLIEYYVSSEKKRPASISMNATPYDFEHPVNFLERQAQLIRGFGLEGLQEISTYESVPSIQGNITLRLIREHSAYETPFSIAPILNFENTSKDTEMELCRVRIGVFEEGGTKKALLYAIQTEEYLVEERKFWQEHIENRVATIHELSNLYRVLYNQNPQRFIQIFGEFSSDLFTEIDDFKFYQELRTIMQKNMIKKYGEHANPFVIERDLLLEFPDEKLEENIEHQGYKQNFALGISSIRRVSSVSEDEITEMQDKISIIDNKAQFYKHVARKLGTSAPPRHVAGLTITLAKLQSLGVEEVVVPLYLPLRTKRHTIVAGEEYTDTTDTRKLENLVETIAYVTTNCRGVEVWQDPGMSEDGVSYMTLRLSKMTSDKPLLHDLIEAGISL